MILNESTTECKVICSSHTTEDFVAAEEDRGEGVDHNFFRYMCGKCFSNCICKVPYI